MFYDPLTDQSFHFVRFKVVFSYSDWPKLLLRFWFSLKTSHVNSYTACCLPSQLFTDLIHILHSLLFEWVHGCAPCYVQGKSSLFMSSLPVNKEKTWVHRLLQSFTQCDKKTADSWVNIGWSSFIEKPSGIIGGQIISCFVLLCVLPARGHHVLLVFSARVSRLTCHHPTHRAHWHTHSIVQNFSHKVTEHRPWSELSRYLGWVTSSRSRCSSRHF